MKLTKATAALHTKKTETTAKALGLNPLEYLFMMLIPLLQSFVKNPKSIAKERKLIQKAYDLLGQILAGIPE